MKHPKCLEFKTLYGTKNDFFGNLHNFIDLGNLYGLIGLTNWAGQVDISMSSILIFTLLISLAFVQRAIVSHV